MVKEKTIYTYYCDLCGKEIAGKVYSPIWGELDPDGDGDFDRYGDIIGIDICGKCVERADQMIRGLVEKKEEVKRDSSEDKRDLVEVSKELVEDAEPELVRELARELAQMEENGAPRPRRGGRAIKIDIFKVMELHNAGWSSGKIAKELGVSAATIQRRVNEVLRGEK